MVVSKVEFNDAMEQINASYAKLLKRIEKLENAGSEAKAGAKAPAKAKSEKAA